MYSRHEPVASRSISNCWRAQYAAGGEVRWQDDVWISAHLARWQVPRLIVPARGMPIESRAAFAGALHHTVNRSGHNEPAALTLFRQWW